MDRRGAVSGVTSVKTLTKLAPHFAHTIADLLLARLTAETARVPDSYVEAIGRNGKGWSVPAESDYLGRDVQLTEIDQ